MRVLERRLRRLLDTKDLTGALPESRQSTCPFPRR
jgi:hypothetical protein